MNLIKLMKLLLFFFIAINLTFALNLKLRIREKEKNVENDENFSPFSPVVSETSNFDFSTSNPVENSLEISKLSNEIIANDVSVEEKKKPILKDFPSNENKYAEIRNDFRYPAQMHARFYLNAANL